MSWSMVSFASWSTISLPSMPQWLGTKQKRTHVPFSLNAQSRLTLWHKYGAVIWKYIVQLVAGHLTILELVVDDCCRPHPLVNLRSISVDFIMWSLSIMLLSELGLSIFCGWVEGRVMPPLPFGLGRYRSLIIGSNPCRAWCAGLSVQARVFR